MGLLVEVPVVVSSDVAKVGEPPRQGERRLVRLLPTPFGSRPAIWTSPYATKKVYLPGESPTRSRVCVVLLSPGEPGVKPDVVVVTIPEDAVEKFPLVPVEW